jgi:hypothetical protein
MWRLVQVTSWLDRVHCMDTAASVGKLTLGQKLVSFGEILTWFFCNANRTFDRCAYLLGKYTWTYESVSKSSRTVRLERELQMVQRSATRCNCNAILWVGVVSFATINFFVASRVFIVVSIYFVIDSVRKLLDTPSYRLSFSSRNVTTISVPVLTYSSFFQCLQLVSCKHKSASLYMPTVLLSVASYEWSENKCRED